jgi:hypothetical protein
MRTVLLSLVVFALIVGCAKHNKYVGTYDGTLTLPTEAQEMMDYLYNAIPAEQKSDVRREDMMPKIELELKTGYACEFRTTYRGETKSSSASWTVDETARTISIIPDQAPKSDSESVAIGEDVGSKTLTMSISEDGRTFSWTETNDGQTSGLTFTKR